MTAYFDQRHEEVNALKAIDPEAHPEVYRKLVELEAAIVWDVTLAAEMPGFPENLRDQVHRLVLKYGTETQPVNAVAAPSYFDFDDHCDAINHLVWDLHTVFHEVAKLHLDGFGDDPRTPLRIIYARGEERRENMVEPLSPIASWTVENRGKDAAEPVCTCGAQAHAHEDGGPLHLEGCPRATPGPV
jgi:hypothetical protein